MTVSLPPVGSHPPPPFAGAGRSDGVIINPLEKLSAHQLQTLEELTGRKVVDGHWEPPGPFDPDASDFVRSILWDVAFDRAPERLTQEYFAEIVERHQGNAAIKMPADFVEKAMAALDKRVEYVPGEPLDIRV